MRWGGLCLLGLGLLTGCRHDYQRLTDVRPEEERQDPRRDVGGERTTAELVRDVERGLKGNREVACAYFGVYQVLAECVGNPRFPWKKPVEIEADVVAVRELLELSHAAYPEFTRIVTEELSPLKENKELTAESRREWQRRLERLAGACREVAR